MWGSLRNHISDPNKGLKLSTFLILRFLYIGTTTKVLRHVGKTKVVTDRLIITLVKSTRST